MRERFQDDTSGQMIFGTRAVLEAVRSGKEFERLFLQQGLSNPLIRELKQELEDANIHFQYVPQAKLQRLTNQNHQGVIAYLSTIVYQSTEDIVSRLFEEGKVPL